MFSKVLITFRFPSIVNACLAFYALFSIIADIMIGVNPAMKFWDSYMLFSTFTARYLEIGPKMAWVVPIVIALRAWGLINADVRLNGILRWLGPQKGGQKAAQGAQGVQA